MMRGIDDIFEQINDMREAIRRLQNKRDVVATVSALSVAPLPGEIVHFQDSAMATAGVRWQLAYDDDSELWQLVGGGWLSSSIAAGGTGFTSGTYQTTDQAALTLPALSGTWEFRVSALLQNAGAGANNIYAGLFDDGTAIWDPAVLIVASGIFDGNTMERTRLFGSIAGGSVMNVRYKTLNALSSNATDLVVAARPVSVV